MNERCLEYVIILRDTNIIENLFTNCQIVFYKGLYNYEWDIFTLPWILFSVIWLEKSLSLIPNRVETFFSLT